VAIVEQVEDPVFDELYEVRFRYKGEVREIFGLSAEELGDFIQIPQTGELGIDLTGYPVVAPGTYQEARDLRSTLTDCIILWRLCTRRGSILVGIDFPSNFREFNERVGFYRTEDQLRHERLRLLKQQLNKQPLPKPASPPSAHPAIVSNPSDRPKSSSGWTTSLRGAIATALRSLRRCCRPKRQ
jgi:hypothetical protein